MSDVVQSRVWPHADEAKPRVGIPFSTVTPLIALLDVAIIVAADALGCFVYQYLTVGALADPGVYFGLGLIASLTYAFASQLLGLYRLDELLERYPNHGRVCVSWGVALLAVAVILFLFKAGGQLSRGSVVAFSTMGGIGLILRRRAAYRPLHAMLLSGAIRGRPAIVIGTRGELDCLAPRDLLVGFGFDEVTRIVLRRTDVSSGTARFDQSSIDEAVDSLRATSASEIVLALPWSSISDIGAVLEPLRAVPLRIVLVPDITMTTVLRWQGRDLKRSYLIEVQRAPLTSLEQWAKRVTDVVVSCLSLAMLAPVMVLAMLAIKLDSRGPVIFRQRRHGFNGRPFLIYKFRTMRALEDGATVVQASQRDSRITRVGRLLRQSSIDELPQLLNVFKGDMSIVGPRPHALAHNFEYSKVIANYALRHHVKPGMTGWAQVHGYRGGTPRLELMEQRIALDLWYINNWSFGLDIRIMLRTFFELVRSRNAY